jgi:hypothetical protein
MASVKEISARSAVAAFAGLGRRSRRTSYAIMWKLSLPSALLLQVGRFSGEETVSPAGKGIRNMPVLHYKKMRGSYSEGRGTSRETLASISR